MYTLAALPDTSQSHLGFYFLSAFLFVLLFGLYREYRQGAMSGRELFYVFLAAVAVTSLTALGSFTTKPPRNEKVIASFEGFTAEVEKTQSGKYTSTTHRVYGRFRVPEGTVALVVSSGSPIPPKVILYKN